MDELQSSYDELLKNYVELDLTDKREELIGKLKELLATLDLYTKTQNINAPILFNREMIDVNKENCSEDDYIESVYAYILSIEELIARSLIEK